MGYVIIRQFANHRALLAMGLLVFGVVGFLALGQVFAAEGSVVQNRALGISVDQDEANPTVTVQTETPVGYRYTVYDAYDPLRVVVDFPGMDVSTVAPTMAVGSAGVKELRVSAQELATGQLGRMEFLLDQPVAYKVFLSGNNFRVSFSAIAGKKAVPETALVKKSVIDSGSEVAPKTISVPQVASGVAARRVTAVDMQQGRANLFADGKIEKFRYFELSAPPRLVLDAYGVRPAFKERSFNASLGFQQMRVGLYDDRTRFVFDAEGGQIPKFAVSPLDNGLLVTWGQSVAKAVAPAPAPRKAPARTLASGKDIPVAVEALDFNLEGGRSVLIVSLSGPGRVIAPVAKGNIVRFGVKNASISRSLRRAIDSSAFPSAIRLITPYTVLSGPSQDVRFAVELKGSVPYELQREGNLLKFYVDNGGFAEASPVPRETVKVTVPPAAAPAVFAGAPAPVVAQPQVFAAPVAVTEVEKKEYTGQKIRLVFDDADIRKILQLIAEVSNFNIIVADEVKGTITLRLVDVPWDQALDLIMEIKDLGMLQEGNVVRVLPKSKIREMDEARFSAARTKEKLEDLATEVISVSYSDLGGVASPSRELLTERGKITEDNRNKQIIVTDIPSAVAEVKKLIQILDTPERQVMIEARIVEASSTFSRDLGVNWGLSFDNNDSGGPWDVNSGNVGLGGSFLIAPPTAGTVGGSGLGSGITFGRVGIDSTTLDLRISALESSGYGKIISTPRVSTLNGGEATISQGTTIPYQSSGTDGLPKTEFIDANLELMVKPVINPDNSIILDIEANNSSLGANVQTGAGGSAPSIDTKEAKTKVLVRDGETTVIGGIFVENENEGEAGVPLLMKVPILGHLFKSKNKTQTRSELLIFITPRIIE